MLNELTIEKAAQGLRARSFSARELTLACLERVAARKELNTFITLAADEALRQADFVDQEISRGESLPPLAGLPYAAKDLFCVAKMKTTAGSRILSDYLAPYESTTTARLKKQLAVLIGKTNLDEFAMGASNENSAFGPAGNPLNRRLVPGGSSGGSAAAVADKQCLYALGTDTGGSIRQPASFCGVVGLKPTYGRTSRYGVIAMASSLDTIGHFTRTVADSALVLNAIAGRDNFDATTSSEPTDDYYKELAGSVTGLRLGVPKNIFDFAALHPGIKALFSRALERLAEMTGVSLTEVDLTANDYALAAYYLLVPSEVSSNLARYDGIRYGLSLRGENLFASYADGRGAGFGPEVKRRIMLGTFALSHGYYEAYYQKARAARSLIVADYQKALELVDAIVTPVSPGTAFAIGAKINDPLALYLEDIYTLPVNLAGLPGLSLPLGFIGGLPVNFQLIGRWFDEKTILRLGHHYQESYTVISDDSPS